MRAIVTTVTKKKGNERQVTGEVRGLHNPLSELDCVGRRTRRSTEEDESEG